MKQKKKKKKTSWKQHKTDWRLTEWMETDGTKLLYGFNEINICSHSHHSKHLPFAIRSKAAFWQTSTSSFNECEVELFYAKFGAEKEIENQTQISVFSLFDLFNGKSQRKIEMRLKIKEKDKKKSKPNFHKY